jgi:hypothetical protein
VKTFRSFSVVFAVSVAAVLSGCRGNPLSGYVEQAVALKASSNQTASGKLTFTQTTYYTAHVEVCDTYVCGYDQVEHCSPSRTVCVPTGTPVCYTSPGGQRTCSGGGGGSSCHTEPGYCRVSSVPRYCQTNCRMEPVTRSYDTRIPSEVTVELHGLDDVKAIQALSLGVETNEKYAKAFRERGKQPRKYAFLFEDLKPEHRTLISLKAKGYALEKGQEAALTLPKDFKAGDPVTIRLQLVRAKANVGKSTYSVLGTTEAFPALRFVRDER